MLPYEVPATKGVLALVIVPRRAIAQLTLKNSVLNVICPSEGADKSSARIELKFICARRLSADRCDEHGADGHEDPLGST
jgi:hypothetical protein